MSDTVIRAAARALNPDRPIMTLAALARGRRSTAKSWAAGHRRPPIVTLKILRDLLNDRQAALFQLILELNMSSCSESASRRASRALTKSASAMGRVAYRATVATSAVGHGVQ